MTDQPLILVVDDEPLMRTVLGDALRGQGYRVETASSGLEALVKAAELDPDLVLLDVMMPGLDGLAVLGQLRADPRLADIPVVLVTSLDDRASRVAGIDAGADDYIGKPFDRAELRARVRTITRLNRYRKLHDANRQVLEAYDTTLVAWIKLLDLRDKETAGHTERVTHATVELARAADIPEEQIVHVRRGALLHDIGKIIVPDQILHKAGSLSPEEWAVMKLHPTHARDLMQCIPFLWPAMDIPAYHHERFDGTGYPHQLAGEKIPLAARLFAVVDVWDALSNERPYKPAWPREKVIGYLQTQAGTHFDPFAVEIFLAWEKRTVAPTWRSGVGE